MTTYNYVAASSAAAVIEPYVTCTSCNDKATEIQQLTDKVNEVANKKLRLTEGIQQQLKLLVEDESIDVATCNDITDALGIERVQFVKEYEVTLSGTWYVTVTLEATDVDDADTQCQDIDINIDVDLPYGKGITLHAAELEHDDCQIAEA